LDLVSSGPQLSTPSDGNQAPRTRVDLKMATLYIKNSLKTHSAQMQKICDAAAEHEIAVHLGNSENENSSLYMAQSLIGSDEKIKMSRRKIKPTYVERSVFGEGSGSSLYNVVDVPSTST
jgi:nitrilase